MLSENCCAVAGCAYEAGQAAPRTRTLFVRPHASGRLDQLLPSPPLSPQPPRPVYQMDGCESSKSTRHRLSGHGGRKGGTTSDRLSHLPVAARLPE